MKDSIITILIIIAIVSLFFNGWQFYQRTQVPLSGDVLHITDTIYVDNIRIQEKTKLKYITKFDTIKEIQVKDSIIHDSISLPISHYNYKDTLKNDSLTSYISIDYSGFHSQINNLELVNDLHYTIPQKKPRKFHIALSAGYYTGYNLIDRKLYSGPGAGISFTYDLW